MKKARPRLPSLNKAPEAAPPDHGWPSRPDEASSSSDRSSVDATQAKDTGPRLPAIDYERYKVPAEPNSRLEYTIFERRGVRDFVFRSFKDSRKTIHAVAKDQDDPEDVFNSLITYANRALSNAGEKPLSEAVKLYKEEDFEGKSPVSTVDFSLAVWRGMIAEKHGYLSPEAAAATFLATADKVSHMLGGDEEKLGLVCALCEAWHWFHMERRASTPLLMLASRLPRVAYVPRP